MDKTFHVVNNDNEEIRLEGGLSWEEFKKFWVAPDDKACEEIRDVLDKSHDALASQVWHKVGFPLNRRWSASNSRMII